MNTNLVPFITKFGVFFFSITSWILPNLL